MSIITSLQNNELPGFYSAVAAINHPIKNNAPLVQLMRHYAEEDQGPSVVGGAVVFNSRTNRYERVSVKGFFTLDGFCFEVFYPNSSELLGRISIVVKKRTYGPAGRNFTWNAADHICVVRIDSFKSHLRGVGTTLMQIAMEMSQRYGGKVALESGPAAHPFYYKLGMLWADRPCREYDFKKFEKARSHVLKAWRERTKPDQTTKQFYDLVCEAEKEIQKPGPDYDWIVLKEIESAKKEKRQAYTCKLAPLILRLYFPEKAIATWKPVVEQRPILYPSKAAQLRNH